MKSIAQERAKFAYEKVEKALKAMGKGSAREFSSFVAGIPTMVMQNGLGHTLCFLLAKAADQKENTYKKSGGDAKYWCAFDAIAGWLSKRGLLTYSDDKPVEIINKLSSLDALAYMARQEEALRFLEWLKVVSKMFVEK